MLVINNLDKQLSKKSVLTCSHFIFENKIYWLQGENGTGKSLLLQILSGLDKKITGEVINENSHLTTLYLTHSGIGLPFLSIKENIALAAKALGIQLLDDEYQALFEDKCLLSTRYDQSSLGNQLKVGLSLLFSKNDYGLIVLDETFSALDARSRDIIARRLMELTQSVILIVSHDVLPKELTDKVSVLSVELFKEGELHENN